MSGYTVERYTMEVAVIDKEVSAGVSIVREGEKVEANSAIEGAEIILQNDNMSDNRMRFFSTTRTSGLKRTR